MNTNNKESYKPEEALLFENKVKSRLGWNRPRAAFLTDFIIALIKVRTVCLSEIALAMIGKAQAASKYKKLQRFFRHFEIDFDLSAEFLGRLIPAAAESAWILTMDRTNWRFGKIDINILLVGAAHQGIAFPIFWITLNKKGNSNTLERIEIINRFIGLFGTEKIQTLTADREFIGKAWFKWLIGRGISFRIRVKNNFQVISSKGNSVPVKELFKNLRKGESRSLKGRRLICGVYLYIVGAKLRDGQFLIIVTDKNPETAMDDYKKRWEIETLFSCFKSRGFNFESTHITAQDRIMKMIALLSAAFCWCHLTGELKNVQKPISIKTHGRKAVSIFRYGLDAVREVLFNISYNFKEFNEIFKILTDRLNEDHVDAPHFG